MEAEAAADGYAVAEAEVAAPEAVATEAAVAPEGDRTEAQLATDKGAGRGASGSAAVPQRARQTTKKP